MKKPAPAPAPQREQVSLVVKIMAVKAIEAAANYFPEHPDELLASLKLAAAWTEQQIARTNAAASRIGE